MHVTHAVDRAALSAIVEGVGDDPVGAGQATGGVRRVAWARLGVRVVQGRAAEDGPRVPEPAQTAVQLAGQPVQLFGDELIDGHHHHQPRRLLEQGQRTETEGEQEQGDSLVAVGLDIEAEGGLTPGC